MNQFVLNIYLLIFYFLFEADENEVIRIKEDENSGVEWIDIDKAEEITNEEKMKPIYKKLNNKIKDYNL